MKSAHCIFILTLALMPQLSLSSYEDLTTWWNMITPTKSAVFFHTNGRLKRPDESSLTKKPKQPDPTKGKGRKKQCPRQTS